MLHCPIKLVKKGGGGPYKFLFSIEKLGQCPEHEDGRFKVVVHGAVIGSYIV